MPALENPLKLRWGFRSIGEFIGTDERKAQYLVKSGRLPAAKVGKQRCASETVLSSALASRMMERSEPPWPGT